MIRQPKLVTDCRLMRPASLLPLLKPAPARRARLVGGRLLLWFPSFFLINREPSGKQSCAKEKEKKKDLCGEKREEPNCFYGNLSSLVGKEKKEGDFILKDARLCLSSLFFIRAPAR